MRATPPRATLPSETETYFAENLLAICHLVEAKISHELNLINHRVSWLAASQSFLFLALFTLIPFYKRDVGQLPISVFLFIIPMLGISLCFPVLFAVNAALDVLAKYLLPERGNLVESLNRLSGMSFSKLAEDRITNFLGAMPAWWFPVAFILSWFITLGLVIWMHL